MRYAPAPDLRRFDDDRVVLGGSPLTFLRLTPAGSRLLRRLLDGADVALRGAEGELAARLVDSGMLRPRPDVGDGPYGPGDVVVVVPAHGRPTPLDDALGALVAVGAAHPGDRPGRLVVVDDGSPEPAAIDSVARRHGAEVLRRSERGGPGAARNAGWRSVAAPVVAFVDSDVVVRPGWLSGALSQFADPGVGLVAPRVRTAEEADRASWWGRFEACRSPLDLGAEPGPVRPRSRVAYVPAAALVVRRAALEQLEGFDESLVLGEDVDLLWRAAEAGIRAWYCGDDAVVAHPRRADLPAALRQRFDYGTTAAPLDRRHPGAVSPVGVTGWSVAVWAAVVSGHPLAAGGIAVGTTAALARRLDFLPQPGREAARLALSGHVRAGEPLARALLRPWFPLTVVAAVASRRARRWGLAAAVAPPLLEWARRRPDLDPVSWVVASTIDDLAYSAGVWAGCARARRWGALRPDLRRWPGRRSRAATGPAGRLAH